MRYSVSRFEGPAGFEVFDELEARAELDRRAGPLVRFEGDRFELNRPALEFLVVAAGLASRSSLQHRGLLLGVDAVGRRAAVAVAPLECPPGKRIKVVLYGDPMVRTGLSAEWPLAVPGREFLEFYGLAVQGVTKAAPVDGVLTFRVLVESEAVLARARASAGSEGLSGGV